MSTPTWPAQQNITPEQLKAALDSGKEVFLLDVREAHERSVACLKDNLHIPVGQLPTRSGELDGNAELVIYCRTGNRSGMAADALRQKGFTNVHNLLGGINAWAERIDPSLSKY